MSVSYLVPFDSVFAACVANQPCNETQLIVPTDINNPGPSNTSLWTPNTPPAPTGANNSLDDNNILGISESRLRNGDITMKDIPVMIASAVEYLMALAGSIAVVALIYHAVRMQLASGITGDSSWVDKAKRGMKGALLGFILAMSAWFLMSRLVVLLSSL